MSDEVIVEAEETPAEQESKKKRSRLILLATFAALAGWLGYKCGSASPTCPPTTPRWPGI